VVDVEHSWCFDQKGDAAYNGDTANLQPISHASGLSSPANTPASEQESNNHDTFCIMPREYADTIGYCLSLRYSATPYTKAMHTMAPDSEATYTELVDVQTNTNAHQLTMQTAR